MPRRLSPFDDDDDEGERYDAFPACTTCSSRSSSGGSLQLPSPASVPRPKRINMGGTVLPQDSMRGRKSYRSSKNNTSSSSSSNSSSNSAKQINQMRNAKLLAAAGLDLFRQGLTFDGTRPRHREPRHPAVSPNLKSIPEDEHAFASSSSSSAQTQTTALPMMKISTESQVIVVLGGGSLTPYGEVNTCVAHRIDKAVQLYWDVTKVFAEKQANSFCYLVPMAEESGDDGVLECEAIRNVLVSAGISPHHIIMDCSASSIIDNTLLLVPVLRHLHIDIVHVVTSDFHTPRVQKCIDGILRAVPDMAFRTSYHTALDGFRATERAQHVNHEKILVNLIDEVLAKAIDCVKNQRRSSITRHSYRGVA